MKKIKYILVVLVLSLTVLSGCSLPGLGSKSTKNDVKITALSTSESQIISHMLRLLIEHDTHGKIKPTLVNNLGSSTIQHNALINGDANISGVRYNGTDLTGALKEAPIKDPKKAMIATQQGFKKKFDQTFFDSYGFANTYAFMVTKETAKKYHLETVSDLAKVAGDLVIGPTIEFPNREDGLIGLEKAYNMKFKQVKPVDGGLRYTALVNNETQVIDAFTTDGLIDKFQLVVLEDDKEFFPPYDAVPIIREDTLKEFPELKDILGKLDGKLTEEKMRKLNYEVDINKRDVKTVAIEFLKSEGLIE